VAHWEFNEGKGNTVFYPSDRHDSRRLHGGFSEVKWYVGSWNV